MSDSDNKIECEAHGSADITFVCQHLVGGEHLGFNLGYDPEEPDELYPAAWCDECERVLEEEGEWNDKSEAFADIKLLCAHCYEDTRERNWLQDDEVFHELISSSFQYMEEKQNGFIEKYKANDHERWDWYQETGTLVFSHDGEPQVEAEIHFSGSFSNKSNTWMWAWANDSLDETVKSSSRKAKEIGEELGLLKLVAAHWDATEVDGWEMTAVLAKAMNAIGAYRTPSDSGFTFMVVTKAKWVNKNKIVQLFS
ncbi:MAG: hypothetical protein OQK75_05630 [Gammaproteobacteria bacterium]|nr:hypothetical protein [Gammaproteobacteria bacterium]